VRLFVGLAIVEGIDGAVLDDASAMRACLEAGVVAGGFTLHELRVVKFDPVGVTAAAIVGESHLALHTWPEEGRMFVDVASCSTEASVEAAIDALVAALPGARIAERELRVLGASAARR
jgi:S-adenosylmethionine decarboxylase